MYAVDVVAWRSSSGRVIPECAYVFRITNYLYPYLDARARTLGCQRLMSQRPPYSGGRPPPAHGMQQVWRLHGLAWQTAKFDTQE